MPARKHSQFKRRHYEHIQRMIAIAYSHAPPKSPQRQTLDLLVDLFSRGFAADNPRFDRALFRWSILQLARDPDVATDFHTWCANSKPLRHVARPEAFPRGIRALQHTARPYGPFRSRP